MDLEKIKAGEEVEVYLHQYITGCICGYLALSDTPDRSECMLIGKGKVRFEMVSDEESINNALTTIDTQIEEVKAEAMDKVARLQGQKADLLALTHQ